MCCPRLRPPRRDWSKPAEAGHLFDTASKPRSLRIRRVCGAARTSVPSGSQRGDWPGSRDPRRPVPSLRAGTSAPEPLRAALRPQPLFSPGLCGELGRRLQVTIVTRSPGFGPGITCSLTSPRPSLLPRGHPFSSEFSKCLGSKVSNQRPRPSR